MTQEINRYGLSRDIPADVQREVRRRSKFGCVICRDGFYVYEHIDPEFRDATAHDPTKICLLCAACHARVTRKQLSKKAVSLAYERIQSLPEGQALPPTGPLDFHDGRAELLIGGIDYYPAVRCLIRYHGCDFVSVSPGKVAGEPGTISAIFLDDQGRESLALINNEWRGSLNSWDIEVNGPRITVRRRSGQIVLQLRLDPPGKIVAERLDMRIGDAHVLATELTYAVGRYSTSDLLGWAHVDVGIEGCSPFGAALEFTTRDDLQRRHEMAIQQNVGTSMATADHRIAMIGGVGVLIKDLGISVATASSRFYLRNFALGMRSLSDMRRVVFSHPDAVDRFIAGQSV